MVERPLSVVKELVENALDAGARVVSIELEDGGRRLIRVVDDGAGIPAAELPLALKPHHTSKIRSFEDLFGLSTLGFRGEALAAIGAVSRLRLASQHAASRAADGAAALAAEVQMEGGVLLGSAISSLQQGSEVEVRDLFFNTPARLKFLRSAQSEAGQVAALLTAYALAYPEVRWTLSSRSASGVRTLLRSDGDGDLESVVRDLLGRELAEDLAPVHFEFPPSAVTGFISAPHRHFHNRTRQWYFVNRRPVQNKLLYRAADDAVREFLSPGKFPAGAFFLELAPEEIDVNVHPAKTEINFAKPQEVYSLLVTALRRALGEASTSRARRLTQGMAVVVRPVEPDEQSRPAAASGAAALPLDEPLLEREAPAGQRAIPVYETGDRLPAAAPAREPLSIRNPSPVLRRSGSAVNGPGGHYATPDSSGPEAVSADTGSAGSAAGLAGSVRQVGDSFLVLTTAEAVYLIDQHAAHERILFEKFWERLNRPELAALSQRLLFALEVELSPAEAEIAARHLDELRELGFSAELDGAAGLRVQAVPVLLAHRVNAEFMQAVVADLAAGQGGSATLEDRRKLVAATLACKAAVKAGDPLPPKSAPNCCG